VPGAGRSDVNASRAKNSSRKKICEILRQSGNREPAKNSSTRRERQRFSLQGK
jgi:hypothetical protein